jgi:hypothetical protein
MHRTEAQDELYGGADLHGNNVFLTLCDRQGKRVMQRRVKSNLKAVSQALGPYEGRVSRLAVESTYNWYWFVDGLREQGWDVRLANPAKMGQYEGLKMTDDASDAGWIAEQVPFRDSARELCVSQGSAADPGCVKAANVNRPATDAVAVEFAESLRPAWAGLPECLPAQAVEATGGGGVETG